MVEFTAPQNQDANSYQLQKMKKCHFFKTQLEKAFSECYYFKNRQAMIQ